jgi:hypothetical protein
MDLQDKMHNLFPFGPHKTLCKNTEVLRSMKERGDINKHKKISKLLENKINLEMKIDLRG